MLPFSSLTNLFSAQWQEWCFKKAHLITWWPCSSPVLVPTILTSPWFITFNLLTCLVWPSSILPQSPYCLVSCDYDIHPWTYWMVNVIFSSFLNLNVTLSEKLLAISLHQFNFPYYFLVKLSADFCLRCHSCVSLHFTVCPKSVGVCLSQWLLCPQYQVQGTKKVFTI
jgi:hypothetical protein